MDQNRFTEKSLEALSAAQGLAAKLNHQQMDVEHLLLALLDQERGLATSILNKAEVPVDGLKLKVHRELEKLPRVTGGSGDIGMTSRLSRLLSQAESEAKQLKDEYVSVEHFLLAMADDNGTAGRVLKEFGVTLRPPAGSHAAGARSSAGDFAQSGSDLRGFGEIWPRFDAICARRQARSSDWPRRGDSPRHSSFVAAHQEQSGAHR